MHESFIVLLFLVFLFVLLKIFLFYSMHFSSRLSFSFVSDVVYVCIPVPYETSVQFPCS